MKELFQRSVFGLIYVLLIIYLVYFNFSPLLFTIFGIIALHELGRILNFSAVDIRIWYAIFIAGFLPWISTVFLNTLFLEIPSFNAYTTWLNTSGFSQKIKTFFEWRWLWIFIILSIGFIIYYPRRWSSYLPAGYIIMPFIFASEIEIQDQDLAISPILFIFIFMWVFDTFSFIFGKLLGRHPIIPSISPGKTWEGFLGGMSAILALNYLFHSYRLLPFQYNYTGFILASLLGTFAFLGDMFESKLKRMAGIKDSGTFIPGHGGILDRIDSFLFAAPAFYLFYPLLLKL